MTTPGAAAKVPPIGTVIPFPIELTTDEAGDYTPELLGQLADAQLLDELGYLGTLIERMAACGHRRLAAIETAHRAAVQAELSRRGWA